MANYRQIHTKIWKDDWFVELPIPDKLLFIYLFGNDNSNLTGLYKISLRVMAFETGLDADYVTQALKRFEDDKRIVYRDNIIWIVHMWKYHNSASPLVQARIMNDLETIPDVPIKYWYQNYQDTGEFNIETVSIPTLNKSKSKSNNKTNTNDGGGDINDQSPIYLLYTDTFGKPLPMMEKILMEVAIKYPPDKIEAAFKIAGQNGAKSFAYVRAILEDKKNDKSKSIDRVSVEARSHYGDIPQ